MYTPLGGHATHFVRRGLEISHGLEPTASSFEEWQMLKKHWEQMSLAAKGFFGMQVMAPLYHPQTGLTNFPKWCVERPRVCREARYSNQRVQG